MKKRLDILMVEQGLAKSQPEAAAMIMAGTVYLGTEKLSKPGMLIAQDKQIAVKNRKPHEWVSRGGTKLDHGIKHFKLDVKNMVAIDVGASTGGFTDVLLHHGAAKVYAVDVAYGELAWKLREDKRVVVKERLNARNLTSADVPELVDIVVCDASFISLKTVLPAAMALTKENAYLIALIKPQFEVQKHEVGEKGVVRDESLHNRVCTEITEWLNNMDDWKVIGITPSPIKGPEGNTEFLILGKRGA